MKLGLGFLSFVIFLVWAGVRIYVGVQYDTRIDDYISQAATSPTPVIAVDKLNMAIAEAERRGLTSGNTGVFLTYPTNDVGFWYKRLVDSRDVLQQLPPHDSPLEISNTMIRIHESLLGQDGQNQSVKAPAGISIYPNNTLFFWWCWLSFLGAFVFFIWGLMDY